ncbi:MAG: hypothetical protein JXR71_00635 [Bacteroidales bacterium]|nr:hypothetical protein [Bacteroidales bacterium]
MKKLMIAALSVVLVMSLVSCNNTNSQQKNEEKTETTVESPHANMATAHTQSGAQQKINIQPENGSITIADVYANKAKYEGKDIKVRGKVTKYNEGIMGKNWAHIQDGTSDGKNIDLTVTTQDQVHLGDVVTFEGKITLNKDFGAGYFYPVIMQDAKVVK